MFRGRLGTIGPWYVTVVRVDCVYLRYGGSIITTMLSNIYKRCLGLQRLVFQS